MVMMEPCLGRSGFRAPPLHMEKVSDEERATQEPTANAGGEPCREEVSSLA